MILCIKNLLLFFFNDYYKKSLLILTISFTIFTLNLFPNAKCNSLKERLILNFVNLFIILAINIFNI